MGRMPSQSEAFQKSFKKREEPRLDPAGKYEWQAQTTANSSEPIGIAIASLENEEA